MNQMKNKSVINVLVSTISMPAVSDWMYLSMA